MRILYLNVIELNAPWGAEVAVSRALRAAGHDVIDLDFRKYRSALARRIEELGDFDAVLLQRGDYLPALLLEVFNRPIVVWITELVSRRRDHNAILRSSRAARVFVRTPGCAATLVERGWTTDDRTEVLLSGYDDQLFRPAASADHDIDVLFVGSLTRRRDNWLAELSRSFNVTHRQAFGRDMAALIARARVVLNIHASDHLDTETRVFEALGCRSFLISEKLSDESPFRNEQHLVEVESVGAMREAIAKYLADSDARRQIAAAGHAFVLREHSYAARAARIAEVLRGEVARAPGGTAAINRQALRELRRRGSVYACLTRARSAWDRIIGRLQPSLR